MHFELLYCLKFSSKGRFISAPITDRYRLRPWNSIATSLRLLNHFGSPWPSTSVRCCIKWRSVLHILLAYCWHEHSEFYPRFIVLRTGLVRTAGIDISMERGVSHCEMLKGIIENKPGLLFTNFTLHTSFDKQLLDFLKTCSTQHSRVENTGNNCGFSDFWKEIKGNY